MTRYLIFLIISGPGVVKAHGHSHDENPAFKYSKAANEKKVIEDEILEEDIIDLPPQRGPSPKVSGNFFNFELFLVL